MKNEDKSTKISTIDIYQLVILNWSINNMSVSVQSEVKYLGVYRDGHAVI